MSIPTPKQYIKDFEKMGFGMFVHFGLYSIIGEGEWPTHHPEVKVEEYKELIKVFNPRSMEHIVSVAKQAGAKYITLTTRHHDGFSLYDTCGLNEYDSVHALAGRDLVREFVDACREYDIVPFLYHTTMEFWHPDFDNNFPKYLEYLRESVKILCTNYGKIGGFWFDGNWSKEGDVWEEDELYAMIRKYQPGAMIINNTGLDEQGKTGHPEIDSVTFERGRVIPLNRENMQKYVAAEMCECMNMHWGLAKDFHYKSPATLIECLCDCRRVGANFLLNVGPNGDGTVPEYPKAVMGVIGEWMDIFGEAIYETEPLWWSENGKRNFALVKGKNVYLFCYDLCIYGSAHVTYASGFDGEYTFENFPVPLKDVHWMDNNEKLEHTYENGDLTVNLTGYPYGTDLCVRVAKATIAE